MLLRRKPAFRPKLTGTYPTVIEIELQKRQNQYVYADLQQPRDSARDGGFHACARQ
jgi:hypothetical protein